MQKHIILLSLLCISLNTYADDYKKHFEQLKQQTINVVKKYYPDAAITRNNECLRIELKTQKFIVHPIVKTGEIKKETKEVIGPSYKGFIINVCTGEGAYFGSLSPNQEINQIYWKTYILFPNTVNQKNHFRLFFDYGVRIDNNFKHEIKKIFTPNGNNKLNFGAPM